MSPSCNVKTALIHWHVLTVIFDCMTSKAYDSVELYEVNILPNSKFMRSVIHFKQRFHLRCATTDEYGLNPLQAVYHSALKCFKWTATKGKFSAESTKQDCLLIEVGSPANVCIFMYARIYHCCSCGLDLDQVTLIYKCDPDILKISPHTKNEVSRSRPSKVKAGTKQTHKQTNRRDRTHY